MKMNLKTKIVIMLIILITLPMFVMGLRSTKLAEEKMLEQYKHFSSDLKFNKREKLLRSLALQQSIKAGTSLTDKEMKVLAEALFGCATPNITPNGKPTYLEFKKEELDKMFGR